MTNGVPGGAEGEVGNWGPTSPKRLLVVDDEAIIRDLLRRSLEGQRYTVDLAEDGEQAWRKIQSTTYDCILLDLKMPGKSGEELYRLIDASNKQVTRKVIFITGGVTTDIGVFISDSGNPVLRKPFHLEELHRQILKSLEVSAQPPG